MFDELYIVKIGYTNASGFWIQGHEEYVEVKVKHGVNEKNNHDKAEQLVKKKFPNCKVFSVTYC